MNASSKWIESFASLSERAFDELTTNESLGLHLSAENQDYLRFNRGRVRQATHVEQQRITLDFRSEERKVVFSLDLQDQPEADAYRVIEIIDQAREASRSLPRDPYATAFEDLGHGQMHYPGDIPDAGTIAESVFDQTQAIDLAGLYAGGHQIKITANSSGTFQAFSTENFFLDYSLYTTNVEGENKAVKGLYAHQAFSKEALSHHIQERRALIPLLQKTNRCVPKGSYRVFLAPEAVEALIGMLSWSALSHAAYRRGECPLERVIKGEIELSPLLTLRENFALGLSPRFNASGGMAPTQVHLIEGGQLQSLLINDRSAREYGVPGNGANGGEGLQSAEILPGDLEPQRAIEALDTGLYLGNLHYLNWSDQKSARLTGMTRYACFWVEKGQIVAPIQDLRFDESLFRILGSELEAITSTATRLPDTSSYFERSLGGCQVPGMLIRDFRFTL